MDKFLPTRAQIASLSEGDYFRDLLELSGAAFTLYDSGCGIRDVAVGGRHSTSPKRG
jgi:hypothetical protein